MVTAPHILVLDDDAELRGLLEQRLRSHQFDVSLAATAAELRTIMQHTTIDVVILDLMLQGGEDGLSVCRDIRQNSTVPIIMLTAMSHEADRIIGLEMGADDYLTKPFSDRELIARIKAVLRRQGYQASEAQSLSDGFQFSGWTLDIQRRELRDPDNALVDLTSGEFDLLSVMAERANRLLSRDLSIELSKGRDADVFDRSIDISISRLRQKIEDDPKNPRFLKTIRGKGYIFVSDPRD